MRLHISIIRLKLQPMILKMTSNPGRPPSAGYLELKQANNVSAAETEKALSTIFTTPKAKGNTVGAKWLDSSSIPLRFCFHFNSSLDLARGEPGTKAQLSAR